MGRFLTGNPRWAAGLVWGLWASIGVAGGSDPGSTPPVLDTTAAGLALLTLDKVHTGFVFSGFGQGAFGSSGGFDSGAQFLGLQFDASDGIGPYTEQCVWGLGCAEFGLRATLGGSGKVGAEFRLQASPGTLDMRFPVAATLDLPYGPSGSGSGTPTIGGKFTIGSSYSVPTKVLGTPGGSQSVTPLLASHGPSVQGYVDLVANASVTARAKICVIDCLSTSAKVGFDEHLEIASVNRDNSGLLRAFGQTVSGAGSLSGGMLKYDLNVPKLDAKTTSLTGGKLVTHAQDKVIGVGVGIDEIISAAIGVPLAADFGFDALGKHIGVGYAVLESSAWLNSSLKQTISFSAVPTVALDFSSPVQQHLGIVNGVDQYGPLTSTLNFALGDSLSLRAPGAALLGVIASYSLTGVVTNELRLQVDATLGLEALKLTSTVGDLGPLLPWIETGLTLGSVPLASKSFSVGSTNLGGQMFSMAFKPTETYTVGTESVALGFWEPAQWAAADGTPLCATLEDCAHLPQTKLNGLFELADFDLPGCVFDPDGCDASVQQEFIDRLSAAASAGPSAGGLRSTALRLFDENGDEVFIDGLAALDEPRLDIQPGIDDAMYARSSSLLAADFGLQRLVAPPPPVPEPTSALLMAAGLAGLAGWSLRRRCRP